MNKVCVITGGTSGIGKATVQEMLRRGYVVYELSRRELSEEGIHHIRTDVTDEKMVQAAVAEILSQEGYIDVLINNAGFGISGAIEFTETEMAKKQFDVNFFGVVWMCREIVPYMRLRKMGRIVNVGSVAGVIPIPFQAYYSATKAALLSYSLALANEVRPFGITVVCVQPGDICTGFTAARMKEMEGDDLYHGRISRSISVMERDEQKGMLPKVVARKIANIAVARHTRPVITVGASYRAICMLIKLLPVGLWNRLVGHIYAR